MKLLFILSASLFVSCAHHKNVVPSDNGTHSIGIQAKSSNSGHSEAMLEANHYCKQSGKIAQVASEQRGQPTAMKTSNQIHSYNMTFTCK